MLPTSVGTWQGPDFLAQCLGQAFLLKGTESLAHSILALAVSSARSSSRFSHG